MGFQFLLPKQNGENGIADDIEDIKDQLSETNNETADIGSTAKEQGKQIRYLTAIVIQQQECIKMLKNEVDDMKSRSMRDNVVIHNV